MHKSQVMIRANTHARTREIPFSPALVKPEYFPFSPDRKKERKEKRSEFSFPGFLFLFCLAAHPALSVRSHISRSLAPKKRKTTRVFFSAIPRSNKLTGSQSRRLSRRKVERASIYLRGGGMAVTFPSLITLFLHY